MTGDINHVAPLAEFRERLLGTLLENTARQPVLARPVRQAPRRRLVVVAGVAALAAGSALAVTNSTFRVRFFGSDTPQPVPVVPTGDLIAAWHKDNPHTPSVDAANIRTLVEAQTDAGPVRVLIAESQPLPGDQAGAMCQATTVAGVIRFAGCVLMAPTDAIWTHYKIGDSPPGALISFPVPNVAVITGYVPRSAISVALTVSNGRHIKAGVLNGVWVAVVTATELDVSVLDGDHGSKQTIELEARDRTGQVVNRQTRLGL